MPTCDGRQRSGTSSPRRSFRWCRRPGASGSSAASATAATTTRRVPKRSPSTCAPKASTSPSTRCPRTRRSAGCRPAAGSPTRCSTPSSAIRKASSRAWSSTSSRTRWRSRPATRSSTNRSRARSRRSARERWLAESAAPAARAEYEVAEARRADFRALTSRYRDELARLYASAQGDDAKRTEKAAILARLRADYAAMKATRWNGYAGYDAWFAQANNAAFGVLASYTGLVPAFERLFEREGRDFPRFYAEVRRLAALPSRERHAALAAAATSSPHLRTLRPWPTSTSTAAMASAWPRRARWPGNGPRPWRRSSTWSAP